MTGRVEKTSRRRTWFRRFLIAGVALGASTGAYATIADLDLVADLHEPQAEHVDQAELLELVEDGFGELAFEEAFEEGDELFEAAFNALDGVGANVGDNQRFSRVPRADLDGAGEWLNHFPPRATGPNGQACNQCHIVPFDDGSGTAAMAVHRDPLRLGFLGDFIRRDTPHLFGSGGLQRLAEEMTDDLLSIRESAADRACDTGRKAKKALETKGISFGSITAIPELDDDVCEVEFDVSKVEGVTGDLIIRPLQWKGANGFVRDFNRGAAHNELGMQPVEITGDGVDGDFDGVVDEMTIGDMTAMAVYVAAQPRPTTRQELASFGLIPALTAAENEAIARGGDVFGKIGCASCHTPALKIDDPVFSEPSQNANFRDETFPAGQDPVASGVDPDHPVTFDLTQDHPDNIIETDSGDVFRLGSFQADGQGRAVVELFGDLKHHEMGPELAETVDETGTGPSVWITKELWGVGSTAPYLHDGRATTLTEAILAHGGEAAKSQKRFRHLPLGDQEAVIAFLDNLVLFKAEEEEE